MQLCIYYFSSIQNYAERYQSGSGGFETKAFFQALGDFFGIFMLSLVIGAVMGCLTALISFSYIFFAIYINILLLIFP